MNSRLVTPDPSFKKIAELLPQAVGEMKTAEGKLQAQAPSRRCLLRTRRCSFSSRRRKSTAAGADAAQRGRWRRWRWSGSIAEDLAELFKLELDKMANQYETNQRASQQSADQQIDELAEKLKELARRQEQELQRQRQLQAAQQGQVDVMRGSDLAAIGAGRKRPVNGACRASRTARTPCATVKQAAGAMRRRQQRRPERGWPATAAGVCAGAWRATRLISRAERDIKDASARPRNSPGAPQDIARPRVGRKRRQQRRSRWPIDAPSSARKWPRSKTSSIALRPRSHARLATPRARCKRPPARSATTRSRRS